MLKDMHGKRMLGIDYGSKRVGIALSDAGGEFALPHSVLPNDDKLFSAVEIIVKEQEVGSIVMGESRDFSGEENPIMKDIRAFKKVLEDKLSLTVHLEPEFLTSAEAKRQPLESDQPRSRKKDKHTKVDASAAALILKSYIDKTHNQN